MSINSKTKGFTILEITIVLLIVSLLIGFTMALFPQQQELTRYRKANSEMNNIINSVIAFSQVNGRLPCPALPNSVGRESGGGNANCNNYGGFVPIHALGINGNINDDSLLLDPWGQPYRYYVSNSDFFEDGADVGTVIDDDADGDPDGDGVDDFVRNGEMQDVGIRDIGINEDPLVNNIDDIAVDTYINLDANLIICNAASALADRCTAAANEVVGNVQDVVVPAGGNYAGFTYTQYAGVPVVIVSLGKDGAETAVGDQLENKGATASVVGSVTGNTYLYDVDTVFVKRTTGFADDFDDIVKWVSPNTLYSKMIEAGQLP